MLSWAPLWVPCPSKNYRLSLSTALIIEFQLIVQNYSLNSLKSGIAIIWTRRVKFRRILIQNFHSHSRNFHHFFHLFSKKKITLQKKWIHKNSIKLNWCSKKMLKIKSLDKIYLLISRQKTEWDFFLFDWASWYRKNEENKIIKMNFLTSANDRVTSFFCQKFNKESVHKLRNIFEERSFQNKYGDL